MTLRRKSSGPGAERFDRLVKQRPPKKLEEGDHLLYEHALRCFCQRCDKLLDWECPESVSYTETECCGILYRLQPWTVKVHVEDVSSRPILPKMAGSEYADPATVFADAVIGEPQAYTMPATGRLKRCGRCDEEGHGRETCPSPQAPS